MLRFDTAHRAGFRAHDDGLGLGAAAKERLEEIGERILVPEHLAHLFFAHGAEAARAAAPGAALFVFTFSRNTFPAHVTPVAGESFVFTEFSGEPQCFLTAGQLFEELAAAGFEPDPAVPLTEYNRRPDGALPVGGPPVIYECAFRAPPAARRKADSPRQV